MIFKTEIHKVTENDVKDFPVGTPKMIKELEPGDEICFETNLWGASDRADTITIHNMTKRTSHKMKKGKLFNSIAGIKMEALI